MDLKRTVLSALTSGMVAPIWRRFIDQSVAILMLHRFADRDLGVEGHSTAVLREMLAYLRRHRVPIVSLGDLVSSGVPAGKARPAVVFTIDDGYADFAHAAAPVFAEFDCPVTVFLTTGPIERQEWLWWDRVEHAVLTTRRREIALDVAGRPLRAQWDSDAGRSSAVATITETLKYVPNDDKERAVADLAADLEVQFPTAPPLRYAAMTWADVRRCAAGGVTFAPHTVSHPMLPQVSDEEAAWEITESWRALRANCDAVAPVFCYPNGAYTSRDVAILARTDLRAAVTTKPRYLPVDFMRSNPGNARFELPRFTYTEDRPRLMAILTGFERVNSRLRGLDT